MNVEGVQGTADSTSEILPVSDEETDNAVFPASPADGDLFEATPSSRASPVEADEQDPEPSIKRRRYMRGPAAKLTFLDLPVAWQHSSKLQ